MATHRHGNAPAWQRTGNLLILAGMTELPAFLDSSRPDVPDLAVPRGITPFYLPHQPVRGRLIRLGPLANTLLTRHDHQPPVRALLGQALALAAALATALKFSGSFGIQARGDGPVSMLLADCTDIGALRGYARLKPDAVLPEGANARTLLGDGYLAFTVDQGPEREPQQGIVALEGETLAAMAEHYFATSEQLPCKIYLASGPVAPAGGTDEGWRASGPDPGADRRRRRRRARNLSEAEQEEAWRTAGILADTVTEAELLDDTLPPERLLYRLFHAEGVAGGPAAPCWLTAAAARAPASAPSWRAFRTDDLDHMAVDGDIIMTCEFCNFRLPLRRVIQRGRPTPGRRRDRFGDRLPRGWPSWRRCWLLPACAGCSSPPPPQTFPPLNYSYLPPITLKVAAVNVVDQSVPDPGAAGLMAQDPANPVATLTDTLNRRLIPGGTPGTATATIEAASIDQAGPNLTGVMTVRVDVQSANGLSTGYTIASATHSATLPDDPNQMPAALYDMTKQLMDGINVQLQYQLQHNLGSWIVYTPNAALGYGTPAAAGYANGAIQATPLTGAPNAVAPIPAAAVPTPMAPPPTAIAPAPSYPTASPPPAYSPYPTEPTAIPPAPYTPPTPY